MTIKLFLLIICLNFSTSIAYPGKSLFSWFADEERFFRNPTGGAQHDLLDRLYTEYLSAKSEEIEQKRVEQIAMITLIYLMRQKWEQNVHKSVKFNMQMTINIKDGNKLIVMDPFDSLMDSPGYFFNKSFFPGSLGLCVLLALKYGIFQYLHLENHGPRPRCNNQEESARIVDDNDDMIREWILSDLWNFLPTRKRLNKYLGNVQESNDIGEHKELFRKFVNLLAFSRLTMLAHRYDDFLEFLIPGTKSEHLFMLAYQAFLKSDKMEIKWRNKIVLDKLIYDDWTRQFFMREFDALKAEVAAKVAPELNIRMRTLFISDLMGECARLTNAFFSNEKWLRQFFIGLYNKSGGKVLATKPFLTDNFEWKENKLLLWENGPKDTSLLRFMAICTKDAVIEYKKAWPKTKLEKLQELSEVVQSKWILCFGKNLKNPRRKNEFLSNLHLQKLSQLINSAENGKLAELWRQKRSMWKELIDSAGIQQIEALLNPIFFAANEHLSDSEKSEDNFIDAENEFDSENLNSEKFENDKQNENSKTNFSEMVESSKGAEENSDFEKKSVELNKTLKKLMKESSTKQKKSIYSPKECRKKYNKKAQKSETEGINSEDPVAQKCPKKSENSPAKINKSTNDEKILLKNKQNENGIKIVLKKDAPKKDLCLEALEKLDIHKLKDLKDDMLLFKMSEECEEYLHVSLFIRTIEAKIGEKDGIFENFKPKWAEFIEADLAEIEDVQFLVDKLYFVHKELDVLLTDLSKQIFSEQKMIKILKEKQMIRIGKKIDDEIGPEQSGKVRNTQFGRYETGEFEEVLSQMNIYLRTFDIIC